MTERERLIELLCKTPLCERLFEEQYYKGTITKIADYLLENGVIVPPCKVGNMVYALWDIPTAQKQIVYCAEVMETRISKRNCRRTITFLLEPIEYRGRKREFMLDDIGKTVFLTREEAEKAL